MIMRCVVKHHTAWKGVVAAAFLSGLEVLWHNAALMICEKAGDKD